MITPARYDITIPQRGTFRQRMRLKTEGVPLIAIGYQLVAQVWDRQRTTKFADGVINWIDQATGLFELVIQYQVTRLITEDGRWDLMVIEPGGDRYYWLEGTAFLDPNYSEPVTP
jgi:hypothetical protein